MNLIPEWRKAPRMLSVQAAVLLVGWTALPSDTQAAVLRLLHVPAEAIPGVLGLLVILGRLIAQPGIHKERSCDTQP